METNDEFCERIQREGQTAARLRLATGRLEEARQGTIETEWSWAGTSLINLR